MLSQRKPERKLRLTQPSLPSYMARTDFTFIISSILSTNTWVCLQSLS